MSGRVHHERIENERLWRLFHCYEPLLSAYVAVIRGLGLFNLTRGQVQSPELEFKIDKNKFSPEFQRLSTLAARTQFPTSPTSESVDGKSEYRYL